MRKPMKKLIIPLLTLTLLTTACSGGSEGTKTAQKAQDPHPIPEDKLVLDITGVRGGKLLGSFPGNPTTFNPIVIEGVTTQALLLGPLYLPLLKYDLEHKEYSPYLAKTHEVSKDGMTHTLQMRKGIRWSDGQPLTADDVLFSIALLEDDKVNTQLREYWRQGDGTYPKVEKTDENTLKFTLSAPSGTFHIVLNSLYVVPKHVLEKPWKEGNFNTTYLSNVDPKEVVTSGPYVIDKFLPDQIVILKRNPHFFVFDKNNVRLPYFDKVAKIIVPDRNTRLLKFENKEFDQYEVFPEFYDRVKKGEKEGGYKVHALGPGLNTYYFMFNQDMRKDKNGKPFVEAHKLELFSNKDFKLAISHALDRQSYINTVFHGRATPIYSFTSPANKVWYNPNIKKHEYSLEKAKSLLAGLGLKDADGDGYLEYRNGKTLEFSLKTNAGNVARTQIIALIKEDLKKIGVKVRLQPLPFNNIIDSLYGNRDFDAIVLGWGSGVPPDPVMSASSLRTSSKGHSWHPKQKKPATDWEARIDKVIGLNLAEPNQEKRVAYWHEILDIWSEQNPQIMLMAPNLYVASRNYIGNFKPVVERPYFDWNVEELYDKRLKKD